MHDSTEKLDGVIDEALREITEGSPRPGVRGRVLARIASEPPAALFNRSAWNPRKLLPVAIHDPLSVIAIVGIAAVIFAPQLTRWYRVTPVSPGQVASTASNSQAATSAGAATPTPLVTPSGEIPGRRTAAKTTGAPAVPVGSASVHRSMGAANAWRRTPPTWPGWPVDEGPIDSEIIHIEPLREPDPIVDRPIDIAGLAITPIAHRDIEIRLIEDNRPTKGPGQSD